MLNIRPSSEQPFIPISVKVKNEMNSKASTEDVENTQKEVEKLSGDIDKQTQVVEELDKKISDIPTYNVEPVDILPESGKNGTVYAVRNSDASEDGDLYSEYYYVDGKWERYGTSSDGDSGSYATKSELASGLAQKANANEVYTKSEADEKFLTEHQDISSLATKEELEVVDAKIDAIEPSFDEYTTKEDLADGLNKKANISDVYTKAEADGLFIKEHQDISNLATKEEVNDKADIASLNDEISARESGDSLTLNAISTLANVLNSEVDARQQADQNIMSTISAETEARINDIAGLRNEINDIPKVRAIVVDILPVSGIPNVFYFVPSDEEEVDNLYDEYIFIDGKPEKIGTKKLDLSDYALKTDVEILETRCGNVEDEIIGLATVNASQNDEIALKANATDVYDKPETDELLAAKYNISDFDTFYKDYVSVKKMLGGLGANVSWSATSKTELTDLLGNGGGTVNLTFDITEDDGMFQYTTPIFGSPTKTLNLRGHNIITSGRNDACMFLLRSTQDLTITGGSITNTNTKNSSPEEGTLHNPVFIAKGDSVLTLLLGSTNTATTLSMDPVVVCQENATVNIKTGNYITSDVCLIYCMNGTINITGGSFRSTANPAGYLINCLDASYQAGTAKIVVSSTSKSSGPKFYDFNPADCGSEGEHTNFVEEGCEVKVSTEIIDEVEHTVYTVVKSA